ncbi:MAG: TRZ/ATZ family protein [Clostridiales bacterium]|nr:TRZ/ATZ family protein [Clostridiales bacterium]
MENIHINTSDLGAVATKLNAGMKIYLSGQVFTARDAAHKRIISMIQAGQALPFELDGACIYYTGPTPAPLGAAIGSCGPTTSSRMDIYTPTLLKNGVKALIGKGSRSEKVRKAIMENRALYFCALGGAGALAAKCVKSSKVIAFEDLGCESIRQLELKEFPLMVCIDSRGSDLYKRDI